MSVQSKNPFEVLEEGDDEAPAAPVKESRKEPPTGKKDHATKAAVPEKVPASGAGVPGRGGGKGVDSRGPKRQHDRHSGTGRGRAADGQEDKRGGAGKYNWGSKDAGTTPEDLAQDAKEMTEEEREAAEAAAIEVRHPLFCCNLPSMSVHLSWVQG